MTNPTHHLMTPRSSLLARRFSVACLSVALSAGAACHGSVTDALLTANNPDPIFPASVNSPEGATGVRLGALGRMRSIAGGSESTWLFGGLLGDEWSTSSTFIQNDEADERNISLNNSTVTGEYRTINQARTYANQGIALMKTWLPLQTANIGELYFVRGFAELTLAQDFCNGTPLSDGSSTALTLGLPITNDAMFRVAMASFDTAISIATGNAALTVSIRNAAKVGKARAQLGINDYAAGATTVGGIPTAFSYEVTFAPTSGDNILWAQPFSAQRYSVGDTSVRTSAGTFITKPSINFASAKDPRVPVTSDGGTSQDGSVISFITTLWDQSTSIPVFNGIDARLIEAEAFLKAGDVTNWLATLNALRASGTLTLGTISPVPVLAALTDPGAADVRVDLTFREKAFWTFSRGQRLSDMRRLIRQYGRDQSAVFPTGAHYRGVPYGKDVNLPVPTDEMNNPNFKGCIDRKA